MCLVLCLQKCCMYWVVQWSWFAQMNSLCNLSCKWSHQVSASFLGRFLSRCCFLLCITMAVEHRIAKQYKRHLLQLQKLPMKGMEGGEKSVFASFFFLADQKIANLWKKCIWGHPTAWATSYCLLPDTFWLRASKNIFKVGNEKFANSLSMPSIAKKICTGSKSSQGT